MDAILHTSLLAKASVTYSLQIALRKQGSVTMDMIGAITGKTIGKAGRVVQESNKLA